MQKESPRTKGFEGRYSHYFAGGFGSVVPSFQLHPVFGIDTERVPPNDAMSRLVGFGDKSWDNFKNHFQTQSIEFLFLSQGARRAAFGGSISPKNARFETQPPFNLQAASCNRK